MIGITEKRLLHDTSALRLSYTLNKIGGKHSQNAYVLDKMFAVFGILELRSEKICMKRSFYFHLCCVNTPLHFVP
jgi:hypothetical protein